ncbi:MAG: tol-pal system protein YbgF [Deltaproteobacteria bacterium]|nr:MAG: tol-pal system protein YbgF [Deltaproteobacteria bacterium]
MKQRLLVILVCGSLCFWASCKMPLDERPEVQKLQNKVSALEQQLQDQERKQQELETRLQDLQLKVEGIRDLALKNSQQVVRLTDGLKSMHRKAKSAAVAAAKKKAEKKSQAAPAGKAMMTYQQAFGYYKNGSFEKSIDLFHAFIHAYPKHEMISNARYWLGENYYSLSEFAQAITEFKRVLADYPKSKKAPGSLLKIGMSYQAIGFDGKAKEFYQQLIEQFPDSNSAAIAREKLKGL